LPNIYFDGDTKLPSSLSGKACRSMGESRQYSVEKVE
jgi:hypothetical protein